tara:strand:- start:376 stop:585 length:210 start_codon:yes stop_codon:yes gene_type:complete
MTTTIGCPLVVEVVAVGDAPEEAHRILPEEEQVASPSQLVPVQEQVVPDRESEVVDRELPVGHIVFLSW